MLQLEVYLAFNEPSSTQRPALGPVMKTHVVHYWSCPRYQRDPA